jgi:hypothetical protein
MLRVQWSAIAVFIACIACGPAPTQEHTTRALETEDPRFQILLEGPLPLTKDATGRELRLRLLPKIGWHMTPEAPTLLELSETSGIELDVPLQRIEDAVHSSEERIEFAIAYHSPNGHAPDVSNPHLEARLKFGVCRNDNPRCEIVRREFQIPLTPL